MNLEGNALKKLKGIRRRSLLESYYKFFLYFWQDISSEDFVDNWHIEKICEELQTLGELVIERKEKLYDLIINVPPGSSKSTMATILFPVWLWCRDASLQIISCSYSSTLSLKHSTDSRHLLRSDRFQSLFGHLFQINKDEDSKAFYRNTKGGFRFATSTGATGATGNHGHLIIVDDAINPQGAKSEVVMESVNDYINKTLSSRKVDKANTPMILIMQRLHENDPTGDWLEKEREGTKRLRHLCLPASTKYEVKPAEYSDFYINGLFDPTRMSQSVLDEQQGDLGSMEYGAQYGQNPTALEGNKIKKAWFQYCEAKEVPEHLTLDLWIDGAYTKKTENDPTGLTLVAYDSRTFILYVLHAVSDRLEMPELLKFINEYCELYDLGAKSRVFIEPKASGLTLKQLLKSSTVLSPVLIKGHLVQEGKEARCQTAAPKYEAGKIIHVRGGWLDHFETQLTGYPRVAHDEYIDNMGYACSNYFMKKKRGKRGTTVRN